MSDHSSIEVLSSTRDHITSLEVTEVQVTRYATTDPESPSVTIESAKQTTRSKTFAEGRGETSTMARTATATKPATTRKQASTNAPAKALVKAAEKAPTKPPAKKTASKDAPPNGKPTGVKKSSPKPRNTKASSPKGKEKATAKAAAVAKAPASTRKAPTKAAAKASTKASPKAPAKAPSKRKADVEEDEEDEEVKDAPRPTKKPRVGTTPAPKPKVVLNKAPTQRLDVFVFGEGSSSELGLGTAKNAIDVKRPRLNPLLLAKDVGVVQIAAGGMHAAALTHDNKILTWGVNDSGALGRNTNWEGGLKDMDDNNSDDSDDSDSGLNPYESTPTQVPASSFPEGTTFVKLSAGDSHTLALTDDGLVYGWGVFRKLDGILGFLPGGDKKEEPNPVLLPNLKNIVDICSGSNHCLAIDNKGGVFVWGAGEQNQLGYHIVQRTSTEQGGSLKPQPFRTRLRTYKAIYTGADHSFAIDKKERVWAWGMNSFGGCGIEEGAGDDNAVVYTPQIVKRLSLENDTIVHIEGGNHHSIALTAAGKALTWGRVDGCQVGLDMSTIPRTSIITDEKEKPRILIVPTALPNIGKATWVAAGSDHNIAINDQGHAYSWGLSATLQTGLGTTDDVKLPTHIDNTAVRGKMLNWAGCGGQYSIMTAPAREEVLVNGINGVNGGESSSVS